MALTSVIGASASRLHATPLIAMGFLLFPEGISTKRYPDTRQI